MKKLYACSLCAAMVLTASAGVMAEETTEAAGKVINYGIVMKTSEQEVSEDIEVVASDSAAKVSMSVSVAEGDTTTDITLPDYMIASADGKDMYLNANSIMGAAAEITGMSSIESLAQMVGITEEWIKLAPIDLSALDLNIQAPSIEFPSLDEEMMGELQAIALSVASIESTEEGMIITVSDETLKAAAPAIDEFKANRLGFVGDILTYAQDTLTGLGSVDVKPAISSYIDAFAEGMAEGNESLSVDDAKSTVNVMIDSVVGAALSQISEAVASVPVADLWNNTTVASLLEQVSGFEVKVTVGETITFDITANGQTLNGTVEMTESGAVVTLSQDEAVVATMEIVMTENGAETIVTDAEGNVISSCKCEVEMDGDDINAIYSLESPLQDVSVNAYLTSADWEDDGSLALPEASVDVLDVVKNVAAMVFAQSAE